MTLLNMTEGPIRTEVRDRVLEVTIDRPQANAIEEKEENSHYFRKREWIDARTRTRTKGGHPGPNRLHGGSIGTGN